MRRMIIFPEWFTTLPGMLSRFLRTVDVPALCHFSERMKRLKIRHLLYGHKRCAQK